MARKALIFSLAYYPHLIGGAETATKEITDRISSDDIEFDMVTLFAGSSRYERLGNVNIYRVGPRIDIKGNIVPHISYFIKFQYVIYAFFKSLILHHKRHYDFIWSIMASFNGFSALFFKSIYPKIPFLLTLQEGDSIEHIRKALGMMYPLYKKIFKKVDYVQAISHFLEDYGKSMGAECPSSVVSNGVDFEYFSQRPTTGQVKALQHELDINPFDTVLITTSRLVHKNAVEDIVDAMVYLPDEVKFIILGTGPLDRLLKEKTVLLGLEKRVRFIGFVSHKEIPLYLHTANIFIRPSLSEGMGISFVEAMSADLPVIATPVGGIVDFLIDGETGLFCEVGKPERIANQVDVFMKNGELRESIIRNAREMVRIEYDWNLIAKEMRGVFEKIL